MIYSSPYDKGCNAAIMWFKHGLQPSNPYSATVNYDNWFGWELGYLEAVKNLKVEFENNQW